MNKTPHIKSVFQRQLGTHTTPSSTRESDFVVRWEPNSPPHETHWWYSLTTQCKIEITDTILTVEHLGHNLGLEIQIHRRMALNPLPRLSSVEYDYSGPALSITTAFGRLIFCPAGVRCIAVA